MHRTIGKRFLLIFFFHPRSSNGQDASSSTCICLILNRADLSFQNCFYSALFNRKFLVGWQEGFQNPNIILVFLSSCSFCHTIEEPLFTHTPSQPTTMAVKFFSIGIFEPEISQHLVLLRNH